MVKVISLTFFCYQCVFLSLYLTFFTATFTFCAAVFAESEGTLILPQVESIQRLQDDDTTTVTSDDSFFSAAEVGFFPLFSNA